QSRRRIRHAVLRVSHARHDHRRRWEGKDDSLRRDAVQHPVQERMYVGLRAGEWRARSGRGLRGEHPRPRDRRDDNRRHGERLVRLLRLRERRQMRVDLGHDSHGKWWRLQSDNDRQCDGSEPQFPDSAELDTYVARTLRTGHIEDSEGTGRALWSRRDLARAMHGIAVESTGNVSSMFTLTIPRSTR